MKIIFMAFVFLALLCAAAWLSWPYLGPQLERLQNAERVKVIEINPFR